jgi:hypothetical protein
VVERRPAREKMRGGVTAAAGLIRPRVLSGPFMSLHETPRMSTPTRLASLADAAADRLLAVLAFARRQAVHAARFGSPASMIGASALGVALCALALVAWPEARQAVAAVTTVRAAQAADEAGGAPAPMVAIPPPPVQTALDYDVAFYWPKAPQTVAEAVAIREGPASFTRSIRAAKPGERLRINGVVEDAPDGPWYRVRLEDGRDGYLAARTLEIAAYRSRRAAERAAEAAAAPEAPPPAVGAPLVVAGQSEPEPGPPSF